MRTAYLVSGIAAVILLASACDHPQKDWVSQSGQHIGEQDGESADVNCNHIGHIHGLRC